MTDLNNVMIPTGGDFSEEKQRSSECDIRRKTYTGSNSKWVRVIQTTNGTGLTLSSGAQTQSIFNIPAEIYNLSKSYLIFDVSTATSGGATLSNVFHTDMCPIDSIQLRTEDGVVLADIQNVNAYSKTICHAFRSQDEFQGRCSAKASATILADVFNSCGQPAKSPKPTVFATGAAVGDVTAQADDGVTNVNLGGVAPTTALGAATAVDPQQVSATYVRAGGTLAESPITSASGVDPQNGMNIQCVASGALNAVGAMKYVIKFSDIGVGTLLALDKVIKYPNNLQLQINWSSLQQGWGFIYNTTGPAITALGATSMTNYYLYLAKECSNDVRNELNAAMSGNGIIIDVPYLNCSRYTSPAAAGDFSYSSIISKGMGSALKFIATSIINQGGTTNNRSYSADNVAGITVSGLQSFMDSTPIQNLKLNISATESDEYLYLRPLLKGSSIEGMRQFRIHNFWIDMFCPNHEPLHKIKHHLSDQSGLDLSEFPSRTYMLTATIAAGAAQTGFFSYACFLRRLQLSQARTSFML